MKPGFVHSEMIDAAIDPPYKAVWLIHIPELIGSEHEIPTDFCAKNTVKLLRILSSELNVRVFRWDTDYDSVAARKMKIKKDNRLVLQHT